MAKLKAPLMSLGATQQLGKALVFFGWKGLDCVREYVIPSNPKSTLQKTQRGYLTGIVDWIHDAMGNATKPLVEADKTAYAAWASIVQAATTWFNQACRNGLDQRVAGKMPAIYRGGSSTIEPTSSDIALYSDRIGDDNITAGNFHYGTSKTALINSVPATINAVDDEALGYLTSLARKTKHYWQFRPTEGAPVVGSYSGIYSFTTT